MRKVRLNALKSYVCFRTAFTGVLMATGALFLAANASAQRYDLEEPKFLVIKKDGNFELRDYKPMIVAEVIVQGDITAAGKEGSRLVKEYIFRQGANDPANQSNRDSEKVSMTLPVTMEKTAEKISMTLPVTMEPTATSSYRLHFVMPSQYTIQTLPKSADPRVTLREVPAQKVASIRFSRFSTEAVIAERTALLREWMNKQELKAAGQPQFARYDPPFVPPLIRRSEILIPVE
ncbi:MAG: heme-binding protein [Rhodoferax sp.]|uniref:SOUL family heme-binding protein n=1 Tax=Rhodoferax sp. TaxID=50421 RepID=UPI002ACD669A|nr:heme-binding protein [Rhodoferax sp.]MDZ7892777.1 heme-binding protein [Rhodoferax sp.]